MLCVFTSQCSTTSGDEHGDDHADGRHAVPQHAHANAEREERQAAFEHDVHGQAETTQRPQSESGLQRREDAHRGELLHRQTDKHTFSNQEDPAFTG